MQISGSNSDLRHTCNCHCSTNNLCFDNFCQSNCDYSGKCNDINICFNSDAGY